MQSNQNQFVVQKSKLDDVDKILSLYKSVSKIIGGLARTEHEITHQYVENFTNKSYKNGIQFVIIDTFENNSIIGEIHCYKLDPIVFSHVLSELTIAIHPDYQGKGIGKMLFQTLLDDITNNRKDILRVELIARESNHKAIEFYTTLGFNIEGKFEHRIYSEHNGYEADIPMAWFNKNFVKSQQ